MHSTAAEPAAASTAPGCAPDSAVRTVFNAVRTLVPERGTLALTDLLTVVRLEPRVAAAAMDRLARDGPLSIHRLAGEIRWLVRRTN